MQGFAALLWAAVKARGGVHGVRLSPSRERLGGDFVHAFRFFESFRLECRLMKGIIRTLGTESAGAFSRQSRKSRGDSEKWKYSPGMGW